MDFRRNFTVELVGLCALTGSIGSFFLAKYNDKWIVEGQDYFLISSAAFTILSAFVSFYWLALIKRRRNRRIFICYAAADLDAARNLASILRQRAYEPWLDSDSIMPGEVIQDASTTAMSESAVGLILISASLAASEFAKKQSFELLKTIRRGGGNDSSVIPVRIDDSEIPEDLRWIMPADIRTSEGVDMLFRALARATNSERTKPTIESAIEKTTPDAAP